MSSVLGQVPAESIPKFLLFELFGYEIFSEEVAAFHNSTAPIRVVSAPARTSKSYSAAMDIIATVWATKPLTDSLTWIVGPDYSTNKEFQYCYEMLVDRQQEFFPGAYTITRALNNPGNGAMEITLEWPGHKKNFHRARATIQGKSATNEKSLQGEEATVACLSEAAEMSEVIWKKYLSTRYWKAILPTTPKPAAEWIREMCDEGERDPELGIESFRFPPESNPLYNWDRFHREEKRAALRTKSGRAEDDPYFAEQFLGRWVYYTGRVLPFDEKVHTVDVDPVWLDTSSIFISCDYGYEDACVMLFWAVLPNGVLLVFDEIYENHLSTHQFVQSGIDKLGTRIDQLAYATGDPQQPGVGALMSEAGLPIHTMNKNSQRDRAAGHRRLVDLLSVEPEKGHPMLFVGKNCVKTIAEWKTLHYKEGHRNEYGTTAISKQDHAYDAARYGVMTRPEPSAEPEERDWLDVMRARNAELTQWVDWGSPAELRANDWTSL